MTTKAVADAHAVDIDCDLVNVCIVCLGSNGDTGATATNRISIQCWWQNIARHWWCSCSAQGRRMSRCYFDKSRC